MVQHNFFRFDMIPSAPVHPQLENEPQLEDEPLITGPAIKIIPEPGEIKDYSLFALYSTVELEWRRKVTTGMRNTG